MTMTNDRKNIIEGSCEIKRSASSKTHIEEARDSEKHALGLYIHIPFCNKRCYYCDFVTYTHAEKFHGPIIDSICREMSLPAYRELIKSHYLDSVFFGGGTPSLLTGGLVKILDHIKTHFFISPDAEITVEANPADLSKEDISKLKRAGVNRISLGMQSSNDGLLKKIGRRHSFKQVSEDVKATKEAGIDNISLDLMMGLPGQTLDDIKADLLAIKEMNVKHISFYSLIIEEKSLFGHLYKEGKLDILDEDGLIEMSQICYSTLEDLGFRRYEVSNFAKKGFESRHNLKYWQDREYWGLGPAAASYLDKERYQNPSSLKEYIDKISKGKVASNLIKRSKLDHLFEQIMMGLRKKEGISLPAFKERNSHELRELFPKILEEELKRKNMHFRPSKRGDEGYLLYEGERLAFTYRGFEIQNDILSDIMAEMEEIHI